MAVTGFWPVFKNLKATLDYADNPDKTTAPEYLDEDLYAALRYAENDDKTDRKMFVGGINCSAQNAYADAYGGQEYEEPDPSQNVEETVVAQALVDQFKATLSEKDMQILELRMSGDTLEEIAEKLGYKNHSGVLKRIRKIGQAYEAYTGVDYGFESGKIIG